MNKNKINQFDNPQIQKIIEKLEKTHSLSLDEYQLLIENENEESAGILAEKADRARKKVYGNKVFIRGLIEISSICRNNCYYCGIRCGNHNALRYKLTKEQIISCCIQGYQLGFRTFVLQGGEGSYDTKDICEIVSGIKNRYEECAVTLSLGEFSEDEYKKMKIAGADRYLLRHETADKSHYEKLHPKDMSFDNRMRCLKSLKSLGYQTGCGFMVGSPYQTSEHLARDLKFVEEFSPDMCGIGPFIPQKDTPFGNCRAGTAQTTLYLLSIIRLIKPNILLPATTALGTIAPNGRELGLLAGANVLMPNLSPVSERKKYALYDNKICTGDESAQSIECLKKRVDNIGYEIVTDRGDGVRSF